MTAREMLDIITANEVDEVAAALAAKNGDRISQQDCEAVVRRIRAQAGRQRELFGRLCDLEHRELIARERRDR